MYKVYHKYNNITKEYEGDEVISTKKINDPNFISDENLTEVPLPQPCWKPVFDEVNQDWIETATDAEKGVQQNIQQEFTQEDYLLDLDYRVSIIELGL